MANTKSLPSIKTDSFVAGGQIKKSTNFIFNIIFVIFSACAVIPFIFTTIVSFSSEKSLQTKGYSFFPSEWSAAAYQYLFSNPKQLLDAFGVSVITTVVGTAISLFFCATMGYALSRKQYKLRKFFTYYLLITMLFNGGMISFYMVVANFLDLSNNLLSIILPGSASAFNIIILRTFFQQSVPDSCIESASLDGANQFIIFFRIVLPMALPALATVGLFATFGYWNNWFNAMLFIDQGNLMPLQLFMKNVLDNISFFQNNANTMGGSASLSMMLNLPKDSVQNAIVIVSILPILFTYPFFQRYFISGLTIGAVKG